MHKQENGITPEDWAFLEGLKSQVIEMVNVNNSHNGRKGDLMLERPNPIPTSNIDKVGILNT